MRVGVLGAGRLTRAIGPRLIAAGHTLCISYSRDLVRDGFRRWSIFQKVHGDRRPFAPEPQRDRSACAGGCRPSRSPPCLWICRARSRRGLEVLVEPDGRVLPELRL
jgi:hypothetical protein